MSNLVQTRCVRNAAKSSVAAHALSSSTIPIRFQDGGGVGDDDNFDNDYDNVDDDYDDQHPHNLPAVRFVSGARMLVMMTTTLTKMTITPTFW